MVFYVSCSFQSSFHLHVQAHTCTCIYNVIIKAAHNTFCRELEQLCEGYIEFGMDSKLQLSDSSQCSAHILTSMDAPS